MSEKQEQSSPSIDLKEKPWLKHITEINRAKYRDSLGRPLQREGTSESTSSSIGEVDFLRQISFRSPLLDQAANTKIEEVQDTVNICTRAIEINETVIDEKYNKISNKKKVEDNFLPDNKTEVDDFGYEELDGCTRTEKQYIFFNIAYLNYIPENKNEEDDFDEEEYYTISEVDGCTRNESNSELDEDEETDTFDETSVPTRRFIPREDMNRIKSAIIGNRPPSSITKLTSINKRFSQLEKLGKPTFGNINNKSVTYSGNLIRANDKQEVFVELKDGILKWSYGKDKNSFELENLSTITAFNQILRMSPPMQVFEVTWCTKNEGLTLRQAFAVRTKAERDVWMQYIIEAATSAFPRHVIRQFTRAGWVHIKEGVGGTRIPCWVILHKTDLLIWMEPEKLLQADLRLARCIVPSQQDDECSVLIDLQERSLYLQSSSEHDTNRWGHYIRNSAQYNGKELHEQQLTKDHVPVIIEKCINFIATHGSNTEYIYQRKVSTTAVHNLLTKIRLDAWGVHLTPTKYTENEIATMLRMYFTELAEPMFSRYVTVNLRAIFNSTENIKEKTSQYHEVMKQFPSLYFITTKRLFSHLHFLQLESDKNKMNAKQLALVWCPILIHQKQHESIDENLMHAIEDLIVLYPKIFDVSSDEMKREMQLLREVQRIHESNTYPPIPPPRSNMPKQLRVWISIGSYQSQETVQVTLHNDTIASEVCVRLGATSENAVLQEVALSGALYRPLLAKENVMAAVMSWAHWDEPDRKDNQLVLTTDDLCVRMLAIDRETVCGTLKFADPSSKSYKSNYFLFHINQRTLLRYKNEKLKTQLDQWDVNELSWYIGHDSNRNPSNAEWTITFFNKSSPMKRCEKPYFGWTIAGGHDEKLLYWAAAFFNVIASLHKVKE